MSLQAFPRILPVTFSNPPAVPRLPQAVTMTACNSVGMTARMQCIGVSGGHRRKSSECRVEPPGEAQIMAGQQPVSAVQAADRGGLLRFQLQRLVDEILADPDLDRGVRLCLLAHMNENPGNPDVALLHHLRDVQDPEDLPPFRASAEQRPDTRDAAPAQSPSCPPSLYVPLNADHR